MTDTPAIETDGLRVEYGDVLALDDLSLSVERGAAFGFLGPNGSGKTTTIDVLTGQRTPTAGTARVLDMDPVADPVDVRRAVGIVPEGEHPPSFMTPREYFQFVADNRGIEDLPAKIETWSDRLIMADTLDTLTTDLSKGQRQKVMLTQAFLHEPELVFIDEPLVNLDPIVQERVKDFFRDYHGAGKTLFLSTHFVEVAADVCDRVAVIANGRLEARLGPAELSHQRLLDLFADRFETAPASPATPAAGAETAAGSADGGSGPAADDGAGSPAADDAAAATEE